MPASPRALLNLAADRLRALPLLVIYITDGCNSRCITCDIWRQPRRNMPLALAQRLAQEFAQLGGQQVLISGGEAMQHPQWPQIAQAFRALGVKVMLLTNGLFLARQAQQVIDTVDALTVSLDAATAETYQAIRGVDGLAQVLAGISLVAAAGKPITTRTTVQRANYQQMAAIVDTAVAAGAQKVSFLAVDTSNAEAFGPRDLAAGPDTALNQTDLPLFAEVLSRLGQTHANAFANGTMAESQSKLQNLYNYFAAPYGLATFAPPRCNAPHLSVVVEVDGKIRPCYFLPATEALGKDQPLSTAINNPGLVSLRKAYRAGQRAECARCVCPLYRGPRALLGIG
jgi:Fe-coproporphyrin III synthase